MKKVSTIVGTIVLFLSISLNIILVCLYVIPNEGQRKKISILSNGPELEGHWETNNNYYMSDLYIMADSTAFFVSYSENIPSFGGKYITGVFKGYYEDEHIVITNAYEANIWGVQRLKIHEGDEIEDSHKQKESSYYMVLEEIPDDEYSDYAAIYVIEKQTKDSITVTDTVRASGGNIAYIRK